MAHVFVGEEISRSARIEYRLRGNVDSHDLRAASVEQLSTIRIPHGFRPAVRRNPLFGAGTRVGLNEDLGTAGLVGDIGHPAPIGGEPRRSFLESCRMKWLHLPIGECQSEDV